MDVAEAIAIIILVVAILVLVYYYMQSNPKTFEKIYNKVPVNADDNIHSFFKEDNNSKDDEEIISSDEESEGVSKKIKVKLSDIDMSSFNTDAFSKKIDAFLDQKSDELISEWSLATLDDLSELENKFDVTTSRVDALDEELKEFRKTSEEFHKTTESKLADIDKRISDLENK